MANPIIDNNPNSSKSWSGLLQNPNFMKSHNNDDDDDDVKVLVNFNFMWTTRLCFRTGDKFENEIPLKMDLPSSFDVRYLYILGSAIHGILCLYDFMDNKKIILWNPAANAQNKLLPTSYATDLPECCSSIVLHGFGYDAVNDDFKVIQYVNYDSFYDEEDEDKLDSFWNIYNLKTNSWKQLIVDHPIPYLHSTPNGLEVYLDGVCHWLGRITDYGPLYLVSFNLTDEAVLTTPVDVDARVDWKSAEFNIKLVVLNGSVAMITQYDNPMSFGISILGEIGVKDSWTRLFNIDQPLPFIKDSITAGKKGDIFFKGNKKDGKLACFDLTTGVMEEIHSEAERDIKQIVLYKESDRLLSKKRKNTPHSIGESSKR